MVRWLEGDIQSGVRSIALRAGNGSGRGSLTVAVDLSVVICTRDRDRILAGGLAAVAAAEKPAGLSLEVVVIDNGSSDPTPDVIAGFADRLPIRRVPEPKPGVAHARNRGIDEARGRFILWFDDDARVVPDTICRYAAMIEAHPASAVFGGTIRPLLEAPTPRWITEAWNDVRNSFAWLEPPPDGTPIDPAGQMPFGANYAVARAVQAAYRFDPALGRSPIGRRIIGGEEIQSAREILMAGHPGIWVASAVVDHWMPRRRQTIDYYRRYYEGQGWEYRTDHPLPATSIRTMRRILYKRIARHEWALLTKRLARRPATEWIHELQAAAFSRGELAALPDER